MEVRSSPVRSTARSLTWDSDTGECAAEIGTEAGARGNACFNEVAVAEDGDIALVSDDGVVRLARLTPERASGSRRRHQRRARF